MEVLLIITDKDQLIRSYCTMTPALKTYLEDAAQAKQPEVTEIPVHRLRVIITTKAGGAIILKGETWL